MLSILILTRNEQINLPACLDSVAFSDDVHVFDSMSTDRTEAIALERGATVTRRPFDNWAAHQNWGLRNIPFRHPWVFYLDADEIVTPALKEALLAAVANPGPHVAFRVQRRDFYGGTWLRHGQTSPFYMRLFLPPKMRYERLVNPLSIPDGPVGQLPGYLDHFPFSKGVSDWLERHNRYSTFEAAEILARRQSREPFRVSGSLRSALFERDFHRRRYHQKELFYRLPGRAVVKFLALYVAKRGFFDGTAGLRYSLLQAIYEYMIVLKVDEMSRQQAAVPPTPQRV